MYFEKPENFVPYDAAKWTLTITSSLLDAPLTVDGLNKPTPSKNNPTHSITESNCGMATPNIHHSITGTLDFEVWESSPSNALLDKLKGAGAAVAFTLTNPTLPGRKASSTYAFFEKPAGFTGEKEAGTIQYKLLCVNYDSNIGSSEIQPSE